MLHGSLAVLNSKSILNYAPNGWLRSALEQYIVPGSVPNRGLGRPHVRMDGFYF